MTAQTELIRPEAEADEDSAKRRQILEGARTVFLAQGFDAASMGEIAKAAGVSKGTLYVYFQSKEELFGAIVRHECKTQAEGLFVFDTGEQDVEAVLTRLGNGYVHFLCRKGATSSLRTVIAIAERMPEIGRTFYQTGPERGIKAVAAYLDAQNKAGTLNVPDTEVAAAQFMDACQSTLFKPVLFNFAPIPSEERMAHVVGIAVRTFLAAYRPN